MLESSKFPSIFSERVDMSKVSVPVMRPWIATRVEQMLGFEDEVLVEFVLGLLEADQFPDPRKIQISLTGFLEKRALPFTHELWRHLLSAQVSVGGVPRAFVEQKKREMQAQREEHASMMGQLRSRAPSAPDRRGPPPDRRWDRGRAPIEADRRRDVFVDKRGNVTSRERDHGWVRAETNARDNDDRETTAIALRRAMSVTSLGAMCQAIATNEPVPHHLNTTSAKNLRATVRRHRPRSTCADLCNLILYLCPCYFSLYDQIRALR